MPEARDSLNRLRAAAAARGAAGPGRALRPRQAGPAPLAGLATNGYLGLARQPQVIGGAMAAAERWGTGATEALAAVRDHVRTASPVGRR
jgi:8-amino-7-oxononanoate synthase